MAKHARRLTHTLGIHLYTLHSDNSHPANSLEPEYTAEEEHPDNSEVLQTPITVCNFPSNSERATEMKQYLDDVLAGFHAIFPTSKHFLPRYSSPCWYMDLGIDKQVEYKLLHLNSMNISKKDALQLKHDIFHKKLKGTLVCIPTVYFIGFPRSGSSQIYQMMLHNPALVGGIIKEPHWWTRHYAAKNSSATDNILRVLRYVVQYRPAGEYVKSHPHALTVDASQSTIWDTRTEDYLCTTPTLITSVVPGAKFIVVMRDPIERLYSDFAYICEEYWRVKQLVRVPQSYLEHAAEMFPKQR